MKSTETDKKREHTKESAQMENETKVSERLVRVGKEKVVRRER